MSASEIEQAQNENRVFGYEVAQELNEAELALIGGAGITYVSGGYPSDCKPTGPVAN
jgi:hypothetical protein